MSTQCRPCEWAKDIVHQTPKCVEPEFAGALKQSLVDEAVATDFIARLVPALYRALGATFRAIAEALRQLTVTSKPASACGTSTQEQSSAAILNLAVVDDLKSALRPYLRNMGLGYTDAIVPRLRKHRRARFLKLKSIAPLCCTMLHPVPPDGGEFRFGAETFATGRPMRVTRWR